MRTFPTAYGATDNPRKVISLEGPCRTHRTGAARHYRGPTCPSIRGGHPQEIIDPYLSFTQQLLYRYCSLELYGRTSAEVDSLTENLVSMVMLGDICS